jgi:hypothetical protein
MKDIAILSLVLALLIAPGASSRADGTPAPDLNLLAYPFTTHFSAGGEFPGATGDGVINGDGDKITATVSYDFTHGGAYVALKLMGQVAVPYDEIRFSILGETPATLSVRIIDSDGQQFQAPALSYDAVEEWKPFRLAIADIVANGNSTGGAKDGVLRPPIREIDLVVGGTPDSPKGEITFKNVLAIQ